METTTVKKLEKRPAATRFIPGEGVKRKALAEAIATVLETSPTYAGAPTMAYRIGNLVLDKDWVIVWPVEVPLQTIRYLVTVIAVEESCDWESIERETSIIPPDNASLGLELVFKAEGWTSDDADRLDALLASKGGLIAKALSLENISVEYREDGICFPWFCEIPDTEVWQATVWLIHQMMRHAQQATRVSAKPTVTGGNDKYAMRCWLLRLGGTGEATKTARKVLTRNLEGSSAWKTPPAKTRTVTGAEREGIRVRLIRMDDPYSDLKPGAEGTISHIDDLGTVHVSWDNGSTLGLVPEVDSWHIIQGDEIAE